MKILNLNNHSVTNSYKLILSLLGKFLLFFFYSYKMMQDCWQDNPENRPTFTQILVNLETIMQKENPYLDLTAVDESHPEYNLRSYYSMAEESDDDQRDDNVEVVCHEGMQHD